MTEKEILASEILNYCSYFKDQTHDLLARNLEERTSGLNVESDRKFHLC
jgi:hypothetical protein